MALREGALRLFLALALAEEQRAALAALRREFPGALDSCARWSPAANLHLTMRFLGDWPAARLPELRAALAALRAEAAPVRLRAPGCFPARGRARVLWAGIEPAAALSACHAEVTRLLRPLGFPAPARAFAPHITLARFRPPLARGELAPWLTESRHWRGPDSLAGQLILFESQLGAGPPRYRPLARFPLQLPPTAG